MFIFQKSRAFILGLLVVLSLFSVGSALVANGWPGILSTEWVVDYDPYDNTRVILSELTLLSIIPKCPGGGMLLDVYLVFYDNKENPVYYGVVKNLSPRDIVKIDILKTIGLGAAIPGKGTVAILPLPAGMNPDQAQEPAPGFPLDGYISQIIYSLGGPQGVYQPAGISKSGLLGSSIMETTDPLCEFRGHAAQWRLIPNN